MHGLPLSHNENQRDFTIISPNKGDANEIDDEMSEIEPLKTGELIEPIMFEPKRKIRLSRSTYKVNSYIDFRPPVCKPNHYVKINFLTSVAIFYVSPWGKKHSEPINPIEIYLNQFKLFVYLLFSSIRKCLNVKFYFGLVWGKMFIIYYYLFIIFFNQEVFKS